MLAGALAGAGQDLGGQQRQDDAVLVGAPDGGVVAQEGGAGGFLAAEGAAAVQQARHEPLEAHGHFDQPAAQRLGHAVDHRAADQGLADEAVLGPLLAGAEQVLDGHGQVVVGVHESGIWRDDAVAVGVGVIAGGDVVLVLLGHQAGHGAGRAAVHADLAVPVQRHEAPGGIHQRVDDGEVQLVAFGNGTPVIDRGTAQRIGADAHAGAADGVQVQHVGQIVHVGAQIVIGAGLLAGALEGHTLDAFQAGLDVFVGACGDPLGGIGVGRAAVRRVVLEATVGGRIVRRGDHDAVGQALVRRQVVHATDLAPVGGENGMRDGRGGGVAVGGIDADVHAIGHQHFQGAGPGRFRQTVGVATDEERTVKALGLAIVADGLRGGEDVILVEGGLEAGATVAGRAEGHLLFHHGRIGLAGVVGGDQAGHVDQVFRQSRFAGAGMRHERVSCFMGGDILMLRKFPLAGSQATAGHDLFRHAGDGMWNPRDGTSGWLWLACGRPDPQQGSCEHAGAAWDTPVVLDGTRNEKGVAIFR